MLLYNPLAGSGRGRAAILEAVKQALSAVEIEATLVPTEGPGSAGAQAKAAAGHSEIVYACGGDGTVHEVVQGLAGQTATAMGVVPLGSANVLARHLHLPMKPVPAALAQVARVATIVPLGRVTFRTAEGEQSRYFHSVAGAGADGLLAYRTLAGSKRHLGRWAYPLHAAQIAFGRRAALFALEGVQPDETTFRTQATSVVCSRVESLGGLLRPMVRRGCVAEAALGVTVVRGSAPWALPLWCASSWTGLAKVHRHRTHHLLRTLRCGAGLGSPVHVQADGEWLGFTPMRLEVVADALPLLLPGAKG